jgi:hypothetical protein
MHQATFTLRQETPLIHFLHDQPGATLRATELKPKLDKMIVQQVGKDNIPREWITREGETGHVALNYKVRIESLGKPQDVALDIERSSEGVYTTAQYPHLLANMGGKADEKDLKNLVKYENLKVVVSSWDESLLTQVKESLPQLVARTNFGNRSNKGFGSFICTEIDNQKFDSSPYFPQSIKFRCDVKTMDVISRYPPRSEQEILKSLFIILDIFYKTLRSGINYGHKDFYFKSLMFRYANDVLKEQWDKKTIKERYFTGYQTSEQIDHRNFLGLSTIEQWKVKPKRPGHLWVQNPGEITREGVKQKILNGVVEYEKDEFRFPSPLTFKPVRVGQSTFDVHLTYNDQWISEYKGKTLQVQKDKAGGLIMRPSQKFDLDQFMKFIQSVNLEAHLTAYAPPGVDYRRNQIYTDLIKKIYDQIQSKKHV